MPGPIKIGTASWTDRSLIESGKYYPAWCRSPEARIRYYAEFPMVEADSTYYGMPSERNSELWVERTPDDFTFNVNAFRLFTAHPTRAQALPLDTEPTCLHSCSPHSNRRSSGTIHQPAQVDRERTCVLGHHQKRSLRRSEGARVRTSSLAVKV